MQAILTRKGARRTNLRPYANRVVDIQNVQMTSWGTAHAEIVIGGRVIATNISVYLPGKGRKCGLIPLSPITVQSAASNRLALPPAKLSDLEHSRPSDGYWIEVRHDGRVIAIITRNIDALLAEADIQTIRELVSARLNPDSLRFEIFRAGAMVQAGLITTLPPVIARTPVNEGNSDTTGTQPDIIVADK